jgi:tetratricopeptide (TPR) repeat protein
MRARFAVACLLGLLTGCQTIGSSKSALDAAQEERLRTRLNQLAVESSATVASETPDDEVTPALRAAVDLARAGRNEDALAALAEILRDDPEHIETIQLTAAAARRVGDWRLHDAALRKLVELEAESPGTLNQCGKALLRSPSQDEFDGESARVGLRALRRAVELAPDSSAFALDLFAALAERQLDAEAEAVLSQAARNCPQDSLLPMAGARYFEARDRWPEAVRQYDKALVISPHNLLWRRERGICLTRLKQWDDACRDLEPALRDADPTKLKAAFLAWADAAFRAGRFEEALAALDRLRDEADYRTPDTEHQRIRCLIRLQQFDAATSAALQAMIDWPENTDLRQLVTDLERLPKSAS